MDYDFYFEFGEHGAAVPEARPIPDLITGHTWTVDPSTVEVDATGAHLIVATEHRLEPTDVHAIGLDLGSKLFPGLVVDTVQYRFTIGGEPMGASPGDLRLCGVCGLVNDEHIPGCSRGR